MDVSIHVNEGILSFQPTAWFHHLHVLSVQFYIFVLSILGNNDFVVDFYSKLISSHIFDVLHRHLDIEDSHK